MILVPAEKESGENTLRYAQARVSADGAFSLKNIAPGRYFVLARPISDDEWNQLEPRPVWWQTERHAELRRRAETANVVVDLPSCKRTSDYVLTYK